jgi:tetrapyrrole methylase family protein / MazG family protein
VTRPRVVVCGLGPATPDLASVATMRAIASIERRFLRTRRHPSASVVGEAEDFDHLYESGSTFDEVYDGIVARLVEAAHEAGATGESGNGGEAGARGAPGGGEVLYAVPGSPAVAESTVARLRADGRVDVEVLPALSFLDLVWARLGVDPLDQGVRLVDAHRFETEAAGERGPLVVAQCDSRRVLSDVKLAIASSLDGLRPESASDTESSSVTENPALPVTVTVLQRLGLPDEHVAELAWSELDRSFEPDHLTSLYIPRLAAPIAGEMAGFAAVVRRLRRDCPWDRQQTHASLRRHLVEEAYEVLEAIDHLDAQTGDGVEALEEELGDLLFQVVFHATLAAEEGWFDLADVARGISEKLVRRHPHVFGDVDVSGADEVVANWEQIKKAEKGRASVMDGIPVELPALLYALKVQKKAAGEGVDWRDLVADDHDDLAHRLLGLVDQARMAGEDPESELRTAATRIRDRFRSQH